MARGQINISTIPVGMLDKHITYFSSGDTQTIVIESQLLKGKAALAGKEVH